MRLASPILEQILRLDPERDDEQVMRLSGCYEFPWDARKALEFALFRTFAVPSIATLLDATGEFGKRAQKRYDDTDLLLAEFLEHGHSSERGRRAIRRMNQIHGRFEISNSDYLYVLSTFVFEPARWMDRYGWRPYCDVERQASFHFWRRVGTMMNIRDIPATRSAFEEFNINYERDYFRFNEASRRVGEATRDLFLGWFLPPRFRHLGAPAVYAMMDDPLLEAFGFPKPSSALRTTLQHALRIRARALRLLPRRKQPVLTTQMPHPSYPNGYVIEELGPSVSADTKPSRRNA